MSFITGIDSQTIDTLYDERGVAEADRHLNHNDVDSWKEQHKFFAIMGKDRKEHLAKEKALLDEEIANL